LRRATAATKLALSGDDADASTMPPPRLLTLLAPTSFAQRYVLLHDETTAVRSEATAVTMSHSKSLGVRLLDNPLSMHACTNYTLRLLREAQSSIFLSHSLHTPQSSSLHTFAFVPSISRPHPLTPHTLSHLPTLFICLFLQRRGSKLTKTALCL
jgi:hypothetical protein